MPLRFAQLAATALTALLCAAVANPQLPPSQLAPETSIDAKSRLFPDLAAGTPPHPIGPDALARDAAGRFYFLFSQLQGVRGSVIYIYSPDGKRLSQLPAASAAKDAALLFAGDLTLASDGKILVADRGAGAVKIFSPEGALLFSLPVAAPASVVALKDGEIAVSSLRSEKLVAVFDSRGRLSREFGEPTALAEREALNRFLNLAHLAAGPANTLYLAFSFVPEPTLRKYDAFGYLAFESSLTTLDFAPVAQAARRNYDLLASRSNNKPRLPPVVSAIAVDPATGDAWVAVGPRLIHFDRNGDRRATYRPFTKEGIRIEASAILVEPDRLLLSSESLGIFEFARPDKPAPSSVPR